MHVLLSVNGRSQTPVVRVCSGPLAEAPPLTFFDARTDRHLLLMSLSFSGYHCENPLCPCKVFSCP